MRLIEFRRGTTAFLTLPTLFLFATLFSIFVSSAAHALSEDSVTSPDGSHPQLHGALGDINSPERLRSEHDTLVERYEPDFAGVNRGIIGRAEDEIQELDNNQPGTPQNGIQGGQTQYYTFPKKALLGPKSPGTPGLPSSLQDVPSNELKRRQSQSQLYVTLSTCSQPLPNDQNANGAAGQLQLFISTSSSNQKPDQNNNNLAVPVDGGYGMANFSASDDVFFTVSAPSNDGFNGNYDYELTASIDDLYATYNDQIFHRIADTDTSSVLIYTKNTTDSNSSTDVFQNWMKTKAFSVYMYNQDNPAIIGIQRSSCALDSHKQIYENPQSNNTSMTTTVDGQPKQQFYVQGLNGSSAYYAIMAIEGNSTKSGPGVVNGGGTVWASTNFSTKSDDNCKIVFDLEFCTDVGYAVPWNSSQSENTSNQALGELYDNKANSSWTYFDKSLQQVACNTTSSAQYSLARNCTDCASAYKQWLCAVSIPRCEDFSNDAHYLQPRAVSQPFNNETLGKMFSQSDILSAKNKTRTYMNSSRNPFIDSTIRPGPYKEVLPCQELCYNLVQSCPAMLQFTCPLRGFGLNYSYGKWDPNLPSGIYSCNRMALPVSRANVLGGFSLLGKVLTLAAIMATAIV